MINRGATKDRKSKDIELDFTKLTRFEKIELFDNLVADAIKFRDVFASNTNNKEVSLIPNMNALRSLYHLILAAPKLVTAYSGNVFTEFDINKTNAPERICAKLKTNRCTFSSEKAEEDLAYIAKIMDRYKLDFGNAFNFWAMRNEIKRQLGYTGIKGSKLGDKIQSVNREFLLNVGTKLGLGANEVSDLFPAFEAKMNRSCAKSLIARQQAGLFAVNADFNREIELVVLNNRTRLYNK